MFKRLFLNACSQCSDKFSGSVDMVTDICYFSSLYITQIYSQH